MSLSVDRHFTQYADEIIFAEKTAMQQNQPIARRPAQGSHVSLHSDRLYAMAH
ncbi:hypothetical protein KAM485_26450 [Aeromonas caviae]|nr:hypothetical protein KAM480_22660 [Aeromonas caviae]GKR96142.1 hypothetical protein KAM485_26450 [Aeromonas caviae]